MPHNEPRSPDSQQSTDRDVGDSTAQKGVDCWLLRSDFYHGYLPREDVPGLLKGHGDFLVRLSETVKTTADKQQQRQTSNIISVLIDEDRKSASVSLEEREKKIKHVLIYHRGGKWYLEESLKFTSAALLFAHYMEKPFIRNNVSILLQRGVRLSRWEYFHKNVKIIKTIGKGAYGEVKLAELHKRNGNVVTVAAKTISHEIGETPKKIKEMLKEARIMRGLRHPNIVSFVGVVLIDQPIYIILELIQALDVYLRKNHKHVTSEERLRFAMGVAWGMEYLHNVKILHRDLAARNCLYDGKIYVKISDFGLSKKGTTYKMKAIQKMPIRYMAPESLQEYIFTQKTDVYTYGILIYEIYSGMEPYHNISSANIKSTILSGKLNQLPSTVPSGLKLYVEEKIWNKDPATRPDFPAIVKVLEHMSGLKLTTQAFEDVSSLASDITKSKAVPKKPRRRSRIITVKRGSGEVTHTPTGDPMDRKDMEKDRIGAP